MEPVAPSCFRLARCHDAIHTVGPFERNPFHCSRADLHVPAPKVDFGSDFAPSLPPCRTLGAPICGCVWLRGRQFDLDPVTQCLRRPAQGFDGHAGIRFIE